ncbi:hypothetical protein K504DRAFT_458858 [Pleomassaria siparia CBS 279.74]|uniref:DNA-directed RNA polymerase I subunit RPA34.5-domain-containing protein n=1 Tax=Pleomassaria siparia CBS 279.74 TaxID=1314801 RepID=A0A6G1K4G0_9PLEO|nr:hypothetical protein K504DRAFT_458858 [Pleomassaria siparia CBS 279.74]
MPNISPCKLSAALASVSANKFTSRESRTANRKRLSTTMKKIKRTPVPLPGTRPKSPVPTSRIPSRAPLSEEFINSSDDSASEAAPRAKTKDKPKKPKATTTIAVHRPKTNGASTKTEITAPEPVLSPKKVVKRAQEILSSSEGESESESESAEETANVKPQASGSDSSSDESDEATVPAPAPTQHAAPSQPRVAQSHIVDFRPAQAYVPPKDFTTIPTPLNPSQASKMFDNLQEKQIWHFTAPADVSLASIKDIAMDKALQGEAVLNHKGIDYGFSAAEKSERAHAVLIPRLRGFEAVPLRISKTYHIQQNVHLPKLAAQSSRTRTEPASFITLSTIRAPRPQVKGLKMNFFPSGSKRPLEAVVLGSSDSETEAPHGVIHKSEKRKHKAASRREERQESPKKKHKKVRDPEETRRREAKKAKKEKRKERVEL